MEHETHSERTFDEQQMLAILKRASELQAAADSTMPAAGLSLEDMEAIAADLGIDPAHLRMAIAELSAGGSSKDLYSVLGLPRTIRIERVVPQAMDDEAWLASVQKIREAFGVQGRTNELGPSREWSSRMETATVSMRELDESTHVSVQFRYGPAVISTFVLVAFYSLIGFGAAMESLDWAPVLEWSLAGGGFAGLLAAARQSLQFFIGRHARKLERLASRLESTVLDTSSRTKTPESTRLKSTSQDRAVSAGVMLEGEGLPESAVDDHAPATRARMH